MIARPGLEIAEIRLILSITPATPGPFTTHTPQSHHVLLVSQCGQCSVCILLHIIAYYCIVFCIILLCQVPIKFIIYTNYLYGTPFKTHLFAYQCKTFPSHCPDFQSVRRLMYMSEYNFGNRDSFEDCSNLYICCINYGIHLYRLLTRNYIVLLKVKVSEGRNVLIKSQCFFIIIQQ